MAIDAAPERLGPLVRRSVHHGAALWFVGTIQFLVVMAVVEYAWTYSYSLTQNVISDLGNTACGPWPHADSAVVCSPWHDVFNGSVIAFGVLLLLGAVLAKSAFPSRRSSSVGLGLLVLAGIGAIGVGIFPENVNANAHAISAAFALGGGALALIGLAFAMFRDTRWDGFRAYTLLSGLVAFVAFVLVATNNPFGLGPGGMERLDAAPILLWLLIGSIHLLYIPAYAPKAIPKA